MNLVRKNLIQANKPTNPERICIMYLAPTGDNKAPEHNNSYCAVML